MRKNVTSEVVIRCKRCGAIKPDDYGESDKWHYAGFDILFDGGEFQYEHDCPKWYIVFNKPAPPMVGASHYAICCFCGKSGATHASYNAGGWYHLQCWEKESNGD